MPPAAMPSTASAGVAVALVCFAGACAPLGASCVAFLRRGHFGVLAASLALAAGVMLFVALTEVRGGAAPAVLYACMCTHARAAGGGGHVVPTACDTAAAPASARC